MGIPFVYAPYVYWKMEAYQNVTPVYIDPTRNLFTRVTSVFGVAFLWRNIHMKIYIRHRLALLHSTQQYAGNKKKIHCDHIE